MRTVLESIHDSGERGPAARIVDNMMVGRQWHIKIDAYEQPLPGSEYRGALLWASHVSFSAEKPSSQGTLVLCCSIAAMATSVFNTASGFNEILSMPCSTRNWANSGSRSAPDREADLTPRGLRRCDDTGDHGFDCRVTFVKEVRHNRGVAIDA